MTQKPFEDLTISDDFMFCKVMESEPICKEFLEMLFATKIDKITYLSTQDSGLSVENIAQATGLSPAEVEAL